VDWAVVEVGLGGRLDATNVIQPEVAIITTIDYDHTDLLGSKLSQIAGEKAGILKPGMLAITSEKKREPLAVIQKEARRQRVPLFRLGREFNLRFPPQPSGSNQRVIDFVQEVEGRVIGKIRLRNPGLHQAENASLAAMAAYRLGVARKAIERGLAHVRLPGRIEVVRVRPEVIVDVAHNPISIRALQRTLRPSTGRSWLIFGASQDKDYRSMLRTLSPIVDVALLCRANHERACSPDKLAQAAPFSSITLGSVRRAVTLALKLASPRDRILITGSFYVAGEALERLHEQR
jgi:dihydrofolate synthase/folylpolyglutamate synthase